MESLSIACEMHKLSTVNLVFTCTLKALSVMTTDGRRRWQSLSIQYLLVQLLQQFLSVLHRL